MENGILKSAGDIWLVDHITDITFQPEGVESHL